ncbi:MAG: chain length determinant protein tyrosine kinase EpsG [Methylococcales bacterium]
MVKSIAVTNPTLEPVLPNKSYSIGALLLDAGKITVSDAERIIKLQKDRDLRFGDAAKTLGLIDDDDIRKVLAKQFDFPYLDPGDQTFSPELVAAYQPFGQPVELFRGLRSQLMLSWFNDERKVLSIVSPGRNEGRSYLAANLAIVFSQLGERTLLIDADLRQPRQDKLFNLPRKQGLSELLAGRAGVSVVGKTSAFRDLSILPAGTVPPNPIELISRELGRFLSEFREQFDVILLDTPSAIQGADALIIANHCGGALILARRHKTRLNDLTFLKSALQSTATACIGTVMSEY